MSSSRERIKKLVLIALFSALAYVCMFVFRIKVSFLTFDAKDAVMAIGSMFLGVVPGALMSLIVAFTEYISVSDTGLYGFLMNFISSAAFACTASVFYRRKKGINSAIIGLFLAVIVTTSVMLAANVLITPFYTGLPRADVIAMIPTLLLPFNLTKGVLNAALVFLLYKPITTALSRARMIDHKIEFTFNRNTVVMLILGVTLLLIAVLVFFFVLNGSFELIK
jgi:riboflavin transporter FmnP